MKYPKLLILSLTAVLLSGCASQTSNFCKTETPYYYTEKEYKTWSRETKERIVSHNEFGAKQCNWKPVR